MSKGLRLTFDDAYLLGGARTPFVDYRGALSEISPIDLGIKAAREAFITAATTLVMPVVRIDDSPVANGAPGSIALALRDAFFEAAEKTPI